MRISYNWLKEFIEITESPEELGVMLTNTGLEVEGIEKIDSIPGGLNGFVVGEVISCQKFEVKEKTLSKCEVNTGDSQTAQIICGAHNVATGQKVIVAKLGTQLFDKLGKESFKIERRKVYGEWSEGMICAEDEIGLGNSHDGILVLDNNAKVGTPAADFFNIESEYVFEIGLTPNRADAASHLGVARDIKAVTGRALKLPQTDGFKANNTLPTIAISLENTAACPRFMGLELKNVKVAESPKWLQKRLKAIGLNPINNVVDVTNYVNHELGQPMHAFDQAEIKGNTIIAKNVPVGTKFITLDGIERSIKAEDLMICNAEEPMGIAGIFGGQKSGIKPTTTQVFLEVAYFDPAFIRKTSQNHGLKTDASFRFERGTDPHLKELALKRAASLLVEIAGAEIASELQDIYPTKIENQKVPAKYSRINGLIGIKLSNNEIDKILNNLDITIERNNEDEFIATVPAYRVDVTREADLVEEVLRIYGFDNVPTSEYLGAAFLSSFESNDSTKIQAKITGILVGSGFSEIQTNSLTKANHHDLIREELADRQDVQILNALSEDLNVMRQSMVFSGLEVLAYNVNRRQKDIKIFEFGKVYYKTNKYKEQNTLAFWATGNTQEETWKTSNTKTAFHDLLGEVTKVLHQMKVKDISTKVINNSGIYAFGVELFSGKKSIGRVGLVHHHLAKACDLKSAAFYAEVYWDYLLKQYNPKVNYAEVSKYPEVRRDLSLVIDQDISFDQIQKTSLKVDKTLIKNISVFDVYQGKNLGDNKKSYSVSFILQDENQTLTDKTIDQVINKLIYSFEKELGAIIRK